MQLRTHSQKRTRRRSFLGFTLVESMIVVATIGLFAGIAVPNVIRARKNAKVSACIDNLRVIDSAVQELKLERPGAPVTEDNISPYMWRDTRGAMPHCPAGGTYVDLDTVVSCSSQEQGYEHSLPR